MLPQIAEIEVESGTPAPPEVDAAPFEDNQGEPAKTKPEGEAARKKEPDPLADAQAEIARLRKSNEELSASERYWAERAQGKPPGDGEGAPEGEDDEPPIVGEIPEEPEPENPDEFLDELSKKGPAAIAAALQKRGYVRKEEVEKIAAEIAQRIVQKQAGKMASDAELITKYPQLRDENSALFKATGRIYRDLVRIDPGLKKSPAALFLAAEQAKLELQLAGSREKPSSGDYREDEERAARIRGQMGPSGRGRSAPLEDDDDDMIGPGQRDVINMFSRAGVDEASYREELAKVRKDRRR